jgi:hypothetical protein
VQKTPKFKKGDKVICVDDRDSLYLTRNLIYEVEETSEAINYSELKLNDFWYHADRFMLAKAPEDAVDHTIHEVTKISDSKNRHSMTLPTDPKRRKDYPILNGCVRYFPAALAGVALISKLGNDKHNPGEELHHARGKSMDHGDCIVRHLIDVQDLLAENERNNTVKKEDILEEVNQLVWRALAYSQEIHERFGAPLAPGAKK